VTPNDILFAAGGSSTVALVKRSDDGGVTWVTIVDGTSFAEVDTFGGLMYNPTNDTLYIVSDSDSNSQRVYTLAGATQPTVGTLIDITLNLDSLFTEANDEDKSIALRGVTV